jgi:hypothetical protein
MTKYIEGVTYRHALLTAYLKITGKTQLEAYRAAKRVGTALFRRLPKSAEIGVPRYRGGERYEIPIVIAACESAARAELAKLVLRGTV